MSLPPNNNIATPSRRYTPSFTVAKEYHNTLTRLATAIRIVTVTGHGLLATTVAAQWSRLHYRQPFTPNTISIHNTPMPTPPS